MSEVSIRELRNNGGEVIERARRGERLTVTSSGRPVAELVGLPQPPVPLEVLRQRWARLPHVDPELLRREVDAVIDASI
jgi:prevent-host-death family protein